MIFGEYPCCDGPLSLEVPDRSGVFSREVCPHCGHAVWHWLSRIDPKSYLEEEFLDLYEVDHETRRVVPKGHAG